MRIPPRLIPEPPVSHFSRDQRCHSHGNCPLRSILTHPLHLPPAPAALFQPSTPPATVATPASLFRGSRNLTAMRIPPCLSLNPPTPLFSWNQACHSHGNCFLPFLSPHASTHTPFALFSSSLSSPFSLTHACWWTTGSLVVPHVAPCGGLRNATTVGNRSLYFSSSTTFVCPYRLPPPYPLLSATPNLKPPHWWTLFYDFSHPDVQDPSQCCLQVATSCARPCVSFPLFLPLRSITSMTFQASICYSSWNWHPGSSRRSGSLGLAASLHHTHSSFPI